MPVLLRFCTTVLWDGIYASLCMGTRVTVYVTISMKALNYEGAGYLLKLTDNESVSCMGHFKLSSAGLI